MNRRTADLGGSPNADVSVILDTLQADKLVGRQFSVPAAYDEELGDHMARFYYVEHEDLSDNEVVILAQNGASFHVRWTGTTTDINFCDGSKPDTRVEIDGWLDVSDDVVTAISKFARSQALASPSPSGETINQQR